MRIRNKILKTLPLTGHLPPSLLSDVFNGMFSGLEFLANKDPKFCAKIDRIIINRVNATTYDDKKSSDETVEVLRGSLNFTVSKPDGERCASEKRQPSVLAVLLIFVAAWRKSSTIFGNRPV